MSDSELEDVPVVNWFDSESDFPEMSPVNITPHQGINVGQTTVNTPNSWALKYEDSETMQNISGSNTGLTLAGNVLPEET